MGSKPSVPANEEVVPANGKIVEKKPNEADDKADDEANENIRAPEEAVPQQEPQPTKSWSEYLFGKPNPQVQQQQQVGGRKKRRRRTHRRSRKAKTLSKKRRA